ncbi:MAG: DUF4011 domain-containing protein [Deltaproteobacteria bacterium]|nr:DUF4011 domain-containing protein [Deltaproteobacteria bacterium]
MASLPVCDYFPLLRFLTVENLSRGRLVGLTALCESSPPFFANHAVSVPEIRSGLSHRLDHVSFRLKFDLPYLSSLREPEDVAVTVVMGRRDAGTRQSSFPVRVLPFWHWPGIGPYTESLCFHVHRSAPDPLSKKVRSLLASRSGGRPLGELCNDPVGAWGILAAAWEVVLRTGMLLEDSPGAPPLGGAEVLGPAALAVRKAGTGLDMGLLMASLLDDLDMNTLFVFTEERLYLGAWLLPLKFMDAWTDESVPLKKRLRSREVALVDLAYAGFPGMVPDLHEATKLSEESFQKSGFVGVLDVRSALAEREERMGPSSLPAGGGKLLAYPAELLLPPSRPLTGLPLAGTPDPGGREDRNRSLSIPPEPPFLGEGPEPLPGTGDSPVFPPPDGLFPDLPPGSRATDGGGHQPFPEGDADVQVTEDTGGRSRIDGWLAGLLDTTMKNALLNYRPGVRSVELAVFSPTWLEDRLYEKWKFSVISGPELLKSRQALLTRQDGSPRDRREAMLCLAEDICLERNLLADLDVPDLERKLLEIKRQASLDLQEGGSNTLNLAFFRIRWKPLNSAEFREAPLILLPARLERKVRGDGWTLSGTGEEPLLNPAFLEILRQDFRLGGLEEFAERIPSNPSGPDIMKVAERARQVMRCLEPSGWELRYGASLGLFSFAGHLMRRDLIELRRLRRFDTPVGRILTGDAVGGPALPEIWSPSPSELDQELDPRYDFCPLPADSSQLSAVRRAAAGASFILVGPPGTGKSQTIANMIAQAMGDGKRVLFVAEKAAALNVVHGRLKKERLDAFCLELHSNRTSKADVVDQLVASLGNRKGWSPARMKKQPASPSGRKPAPPPDAGKPGPPPCGKAWRHLSDRVRFAAINLDLYVSELHGRHASGLSPFTAIEGILSDPASPVIALCPPSAGGGVAGRPFGDSCRDRFPYGSELALKALEESLENAALLLEPVRSLLGSFLMGAEPVAWPPDREPGLEEAAEEVLRLSAGLEAWDRTLAPYGLTVSAAALESPRLVREIGRQLSAQGLPRQDMASEEPSGFPAAGRPAPPAADGGFGPCETLLAACGDRAGGADRIGSIARILETLWKAFSESPRDGPPAALLGDIRFRLESALEAEEPDFSAVFRGRDETAGPALDSLKPFFGAVARAGGQPPFLAHLARAAGAAGNGPGLAGVTAILGEAGAAGKLAAEHAGLKAGLSGDYRLQAAYAMELDIALHEWSEAELWPRPDREHRRRSVRESLRGVVRRDGADLGADLKALVRMRGLWLCAGTLTVLRGADPLFAGELFDSPDFGHDDLEPFLLGLSALTLTVRSADFCRKVASLSRYGRTSVLEPPSSGEASAFPDALCPEDGFCAGLLRAACGASGAVPEPLAGFLRDFPGLMERFVGASREFLRLAAACSPESGGVPGRAARDALVAISRFPGISECRDYLAAGEEARKLGLDYFIGALETGGLVREDAAAAVRKAARSLFLERALPSRRRVARFDSGDHDGSSGRYRAFLAAKLAGAAEEIEARLRGEGWLDGVPKSELDALAREAEKKSRKLPVRELLSKLPHLVPRLCPCLLMSPLSVAQYLPADCQPFDLVIFDEASQIPTCDAVGAIARGLAVVAAGDPRQLPPPPFFKRGGRHGDADDRDGKPPESVLDELLKVGIPAADLLWHYRSRSESLITFSNDRYYGGELVTFPSPVAEEKAVSFHHVPGAVYGRGESRTNPVEAKAVADEVAEILRDNLTGGEQVSVGVVTFNIQQQELIERLLDGLRDGDRRLSRFFPDVEDPVPEPVMVKNLENIQGDERDIMIFSVCYGFDSRGRASANFGPLNSPGGGRRLNVAVTRARREVRLFSSYLPSEMPDGDFGAADLKAYLEYAANGPRKRAAASAGAVPGTFAAAVAKALHARGWQTRADVGDSDRVIDLAVLDRDNGTRFLAGIEGDGGAYGRAATAMDREVLRPYVLKELGWEIIRVWSPQWLRDPLGEAERLDGRLQELQRLRRAERTERKRLEDEDQEDGGPEAPPAGSDDPGPARIREAVRLSVEALSPAAARILCRDASGRLEAAGSRPGRELDLRILDAARGEFRTTTERCGPPGRAAETEFFWADAPGRCPSFRRREPGEVEDVFEVALPELEALASETLPGPGEDPVELMGAALGLSRMGFAARDRLRAAWKAAGRVGAAAAGGGSPLRDEEGRA